MFYWTPLIEIFVLLLFIGCQSAWDICSLFTQWQWLVVTKQIFRPSEFFPVTITDNHWQIHSNLHMAEYLFPSSVLLCVARLQTNCDCPYKVLPIPYLGCRAGWTGGVGGDRWEQTRYLTALPVSPSLQISDPIRSALAHMVTMSPSPCHHRRYMIESHTQLG